MINAGIIFFTSKVYKRLFVSLENWDNLKFLIFMVILEHLLLILRILVEQVIEDVPEEVIRGETERAQLIDNFNEHKDDPLEETMHTNRVKGRN